MHLYKRQADMKKEITVNNRTQDTIILEKDLSNPTPTDFYAQAKLLVFLLNSCLDYFFCKKKKKIFECKRKLIFVISFLRIIYFRDQA